MSKINKYLQEGFVGGEYEWFKSDVDSIKKVLGKFGQMQSYVHGKKSGSNSIPTGFDVVFEVNKELNSSTLKELASSMSKIEGMSYSDNVKKKGKKVVLSGQGGSGSTMTIKVSIGA